MCELNVDPYDAIARWPEGDLLRREAKQSRCGEGRCCDGGEGVTKAAFVVLIPGRRLRWGVVGLAMPTYGRGFGMSVRLDFMRMT